MSRTVIVTLLLLLLGWLQYRLWIGQGSLQELHQLQLVVDRRSAEVIAQQARNRDLAAEVEDLRQGKAAVEERGRSDLGMIREQETFFLVVEEED